MDPAMREARLGMTYAEWLADKLQILQNDAVSFFEIFTSAEDFGLSGPAASDRRISRNG